MNEKKYADKAIYKVVIKAPIDKVWSELIKTTSPRPFFWNSLWDTPAMKAGSPYRVISADGKAVAVIGEILEMQPPNKMVTSFRLTSLPDPASKVTYTLAATPEGTEFCLITESILAGSKSEKSMAGGARFIVDNFKAFIETGKVTFGARMTLAMYALMAPMMPKALRAENWPLEKAKS
jgi:uncharacterized protein YndB with AHSA1/START domain